LAQRSKIEWTGQTWNPVTGCTKLSPARPGCLNCYAATFSERWRGTPGHYFETGFDVELRPHKLTEPIRWRTPRLVFVNSLSDLFHAAIPDDYIADVFATMHCSRRHTFQILTKRPARMRALLNRKDFWHNVIDLAAPTTADDSVVRDRHLPNVWLGVSAENQKWADLSLPALRATPAARRFASLEPMLGPIDLRPHIAALDWVIVGGESGPHHRPIDIDWVRAVRDICTSTRTSFFFKQWGGRTPTAGGRELDGQTWDQMPMPVPHEPGCQPHTREQKTHG
jgi:protein gp37